MRQTTLRNSYWFNLVLIGPLLFPLDVIVAVPELQSAAGTLFEYRFELVLLKIGNFSFASFDNA